ncbi:MAG: hypothetical protein LBH70_08190 [Spirochaetaceae bacterium]|nr:hypothetical protein [Spirochaetaceae bacterium]
MSQTEGNFTNSGSRKVLCLYEDPQVQSSDKAVCFVVPGNDLDTVRSYELPYSTILNRYDQYSLDLKGLGKRIEQKGYLLGYAYDLNRNGREELYLSVSGGMRDGHTIIEYNPDTDTFEKIFDKEKYGEDLYLDKFDANTREVYIALQPGGVHVVLRWDETAKRYVEKDPAEAARVRKMWSELQSNRYNY